MEINVAFAFILTTLAGLSTGIRSVVAYFIKKAEILWYSREHNQDY
ncbi:hypothetical protein KAU87_02935 [Candidatus Bathyarchaeota archaeon]|nr:hypothetical protein [Candidatus Bathyarchaeota archaeon]